MSAADTIFDLQAVLGGVCEVRPADGTMIDEVPVGIIAAPASPREVGEILRIANERGLVVVPVGGMTSIGTGGIPERIDILLETGRLQGVAFFDPGDLTVGFKAGTRLSDAQRLLGKHNQFLPLDVGSPDQSTIGGVLAVAAHGPLKAGYGGVRDYCIGIEFVTSDGAIVKGGGRVVKNVAGYDLMKLMIGSVGTLGVITSANFKVFPRPSQTRTFVASFDSAAQAIAFRDRIISSPLGNGAMCLEIASPRAHEYLSPQVTRDPDDYQPSGPVRRAFAWTVYVQAGTTDAVIRRYRKELGSDVNSELEGGEEQDLWRKVADFENSVIGRHRNGMVLHVNLPIKLVGDALVAAEQKALEHNLICACIGRISTGNLIIAFLPLGVDPPSAMQFAAAVSAFRGSLPRDASAVVARCPTEAKRHFDVWGTSPTDAEMLKSIRLALDPKRILNRGRGRD
jgi:glycolate oxidase FAD binding subunit